MNHRETSAIICIACSLILISINTNSIGTGYEKETNVSKWTVIFYFDGDQHETTYSLSDKMVADLQNLEKVGSTADVNFVVLMDLDGINDSHLYYVKQGETEEIPLSSINSSWGKEVNMGDKNTFAEFVCWTITNYPAEHYNIYLNNHGGGWRGICIDEHPAPDKLNLTELKEAFSLITSRAGKKIDLVSMDACLMSMVEVAYQLRDYANYLVASESFIHTHETGAGLFLNWQIDEIYKALVLDPDMSAVDLARKSVETFKTDVSFVLPPCIIKPQAVDCIGAINLSMISQVVQIIDNLSKQLMENRLKIFLPIVFLKTQKFSGAFDYIGYTFYPYVDVYDFSKNLADIVPYEEIKETSYNLLDSIEKAVLVERHGKYRFLGEHPNAHGLSVYLPYRRINYSPEYEKLDFSVDTGWDDFIRSRWTRVNNLLR